MEVVHPTEHIHFRRSALRIVAINRKEIEGRGSHQAHFCKKSLLHTSIPLDWMRGRKIGRSGDTRHIDRARASYGNASTLVAITSTQIAGVKKRLTAYKYFSDKSIRGTRLDRLQRVISGKVAGAGTASNVGIACSIYNNACAPVRTVSTEVGGVHQRRTGGVHFSYKGVSTAAIGRLERIVSREIAGVSNACHKSITGGIERDATCVIIIRPAEVGSIDQCRAGGIQLGYEGISSPYVRRLQWVVSGKVAGASAASDVGIARSIYRDARTPVRTVSAEVGRVHQRRTGGVDFCNEGIIRAATKGRLQRAVRGKIG